MEREQRYCTVNFCSGRSENELLILCQTTDSAALVDGIAKDGTWEVTGYERRNHFLISLGKVLSPCTIISIILPDGADLDHESARLYAELLYLKERGVWKETK